MKDRKLKAEKQHNNNRDMIYSQGFDGEKVWATY